MSSPSDDRTQPATDAAGTAPHRADADERRALVQANEELRRTVDELRAAQRALVQSERMAAVGQLAAGVAHDFNNLLTTIQASTELLRDGVADPAERTSLFDDILDASHRASHLVRQVLDFSGKTLRRPRAADLVDVARDAASILQRSVPSDVTVSFAPGVPALPVVVDPGQVHQVLANLAQNAIEAMDGSGTFRIGVDCASPGGAVRCHCCDEPLDGAWAELVVADEGRGIDEDALPRVFEPYFTTKDVVEGAGLGLSQVLGIVRQHDGHIALSSRTGQGTTVRVLLPASAPAPRMAASAAGRSRAATEGATVLLVEDDPAVRRVCSRMLRRLHHRVLSARSADEALAIHAARADEIDLVMSDVSMPGMDGDELFRALRERSPDARVILMSGYSMHGRGEALLAEGIVAWLEKPLSLATVGDAVARALGASPGPPDPPARPGPDG